MNREGNIVEQTLESTQAAAQAAIIMNSMSTNGTTSAAVGLPGGNQYGYTHKPSSRSRG
jgi:hypothetical protein